MVDDKMKINWKMCCVYKWLFIVFLCLEGGVSLKNLTIHVPRYVISGQSATLRCTYDLEGAPLYSIRWYKRNVEFYRFVPRELPPTRVFAEVMPSARIEVEQSDDHQVTIRGLHRELSGDYQCEVSGDAPLFHTDIKNAKLQVIDLPVSPPFLTIDSTRYTVGDRIKANCSTGHSYPAPNITWILDGKVVPNTRTINMSTSTERTEFEKQVSFSAIQLQIRDPEARGLVTENPNQRAQTVDTSNNIIQNYYEREYIDVMAPKRGEMVLECLETIYDVHHSRVSKLVREDSPRPASVTGDNGAGNLLAPVATMTMLNFYLSSYVLL